MLIAGLGGDVDQSMGSPGGWQVVRVHAADPVASAELLLPMVAESNGPVLVATVADSDFALVTAATPDGASWQAVLNPAAAAGYGFAMEAADLDEFDMPDDMREALTPPDKADMVAAATLWARAAGSAADTHAVAAALEVDHTFAEESVVQLCSALGVWDV
jgi:hypothetical protein